MRIILKVSSSNEHCNGGCDFALLDLTPELAGLSRLTGRGHAVGWDRDVSVRGIDRRPSAVRSVRLAVVTLDQGF